MPSASLRSYRPLALVGALNPADGKAPEWNPIFPAAGTWTVTLTVTDGWGKAASTTRQVTVT